MAPNTPNDIPSNIKQWKAAARRNGVVSLRTSVHNRGPFKSGSEMDEEEFLWLKAIWLQAKATDRWRAHTKLGLEGKFGEASTYLDGVQEFKSYLAAVQNALPPKDTNLGIFWQPYEQQYRVGHLLQSEGGEQKRAYRKNEELVNSSLISLLQAVCAMHRDVDSDWNPARVHLTFDFRKVKQDKNEGKLNSNVHSLSCQLDGFLESRSSFRSQAILEAKARRRKDHEPNVTWQETMEMVAALLNEDPKKRVILFAQDGTEMYLANAVHKDGYKRRPY